MTGEKISGQEKPLTKTERERLIMQMAEVGQKWLPRLELAGRGELTELFTVVAFLDNSDNLSEKDHLRKMAAVESLRVTRIETYPGDKKFWEYLDSELEIESAGEPRLTQELADLPRRWQKASNDLVKLEREIRG
jgi:hypothetical protein